MNLRTQYQAAQQAAQSAREAATMNHNSQAPISSLPQEVVHQIANHLPFRDAGGLAKSARFLSSGARLALSGIREVLNAVNSTELENDTVVAALRDRISGLPPEHRDLPQQRLKEKMTAAIAAFHAQHRHNNLPTFLPSFTALMRKILSMPAQLVADRLYQLFANTNRFLVDRQLLEAVANLITEAPVGLRPTICKHLPHMMKMARDGDMEAAFDLMRGHVSNLPATERTEALSDLDVFIRALRSPNMKRNVADAAVELISGEPATLATVQVASKLNAASLDYYYYINNLNGPDTDLQRLRQALQRIDQLPGEADRAQALVVLMESLTDNMWKHADGLDEESSRSTFFKPLFDDMTKRLPTLDNQTREHCLDTLVEMHWLASHTANSQDRPDHGDWSYLQQFDQMLELVQKLGGQKMVPRLEKLASHTWDLSIKEMKPAMEHLLQAATQLPAQQHVEYALAIAKQVADCDVDAYFEKRLFTTQALLDHNSHIDAYHREDYLSKLDQLLQLEDGFV